MQENEKMISARNIAKIFGISKYLEEGCEEIKDIRVENVEISCKFGVVIEPCLIFKLMDVEEQCITLLRFERRLNTYLHSNKNMNIETHIKGNVAEAVLKNHRIGMDVKGFEKKFFSELNKPWESLFAAVEFALKD